MEEKSLDGLILKFAGGPRVYNLFRTSDTLSRQQKQYYKLEFVCIHSFNKPYLSKRISLKTKLTKRGIERKISTGEYIVIRKGEFTKLCKVLRNAWPEPLEIELQRSIPEY